MNETEPEWMPACRRAKAKATEISEQLGNMKDAIDIGDTDLSSATGPGPFLEYAAMLREWADEIAAFDPRDSEPGLDHEADQRMPDDVDRAQADVGDPRQMGELLPIVLE